MRQVIFVLLQSLLIVVDLVVVLGVLVLFKIEITAFVFALCVTGLIGGLVLISWLSPWIALLQLGIGRLKKNTDGNKAVCSYSMVHKLPFSLFFYFPYSKKRCLILNAAQLNKDNTKGPIRISIKQVGIIEWIAALIFVYRLLWLPWEWLLPPRWWQWLCFILFAPVAKLVRLGQTLFFRNNSILMEDGNWPALTEILTFYPDSITYFFIPFSWPLQVCQIEGV